MSGLHERDYIERTIATVRNHRDADNCWPQWANIFADEIERLYEQLEALERAVEFAAEKIEQGDYGAALSRLTASTRIRTPTPWDEREFARNAEAVRRATESTPAKEQA